MTGEREKRAAESIEDFTLGRGEGMSDRASFPGLRNHGSGPRDQSSGADEANISSSSGGLTAEN